MSAVNAYKFPSEGAGEPERDTWLGADFEQPCVMGVGEPETFTLGFGWEESRQPMLGCSTERCYTGGSET